MFRTRQGASRGGCDIKGFIGRSLVLSRHLYLSNLRSVQPKHIVASFVRKNKLINVRGSQRRCLPGKRKVQPCRDYVSLALVNFILTTYTHKNKLPSSVHIIFIPTFKQEAINKMNSNKRKERPDNNEKGRGAKKAKVRNVKFLSLPSIFGHEASGWESTE